MIIIDYYQNIYLKGPLIKYLQQFLGIKKSYLKLKKIFGYLIPMYPLPKKIIQNLDYQNFLYHL